jgi:hypothetical protein
MQTYNKKFKNFRFWHLCDAQRMAPIERIADILEIV